MNHKWFSKDVRAGPLGAKAQSSHWSLFTDAALKSPFGFLPEIILKVDSHNIQRASF
jgi:hypothetical protein